MMYLETISESGPFKDWDVYKQSIHVPLRPVGFEAQKSLSFPQEFNVPFNVPVPILPVEEEYPVEQDLIEEQESSIMNQEKCIMEPFPGLLKEELPLINQLEIQPPPPRHIRQYRVIKQDNEQKPTRPIRPPTLMDPESIALSKVETLPDE
jgi:hypothetical protein